jgi:hypothetical protein
MYGVQRTGAGFEQDQSKRGKRQKGVRLATALNFERVGLVNRPSQQSYCWRHHLGFKGMAMRADLRLEGLRSSHFCGADLERGCLRRLPE